MKFKFKPVIVQNLLIFNFVSSGKLVEVAFGVKKLQISAVIEDAKVLVYSCDTSNFSLMHSVTQNLTLLKHFSTLLFLYKVVEKLI